MAGVPRPRRTKSAKHRRITASPARSGARPKYRAGPSSTRGPRPQRTTASGIRASSVPGTRVANTAVRSQSIRFLRTAELAVCQPLAGLFCLVGAEVGLDLGAGDQARGVVVVDQDLGPVGVPRGE